MRRSRAVLSLWCVASVVAAACGESFRAGTAGSSKDPENESGQSHGGATGGDPAGQAGEVAGGTHASAGQGEGGAFGGADPEGPTTCQGTDVCPRGENCVDSSCVPALATCAAQKNRYPASKDGVYWLGAGAESRRAYCDMVEVLELCNDRIGARVGKTRDSSQLEYEMTAVLLNDGLCKMWNIRAAADGYPLWKLEPVAGVPEGQTCAKLGFAADGVLGSCNYGETRTNCGYAVTPLHRYGNTCRGCVLNDGDYDHWVPQGPIKLGGVLSDASGKTFTTCKTRK